MLEWSEQFSMATCLSSHKEKQVRQDHAGHVDSADDFYHSCWFAKFACYILCSIDVIMCYKVAWQFCLTVMQGVVEDDVRFCAASGGAISLLQRVPSETLPMNAVSLSSLHFDFASDFLEPKMCAWCVFSPESIVSALFISPSVSLGSWAFSACGLFVFTFCKLSTPMTQWQTMKELEWKDNKQLWLKISIVICEICLIYT